MREKWRKDFSLSKRSERASERRKHQFRVSDSRSRAWRVMEVSGTSALLFQDVPHDEEHKRPENDQEEHFVTSAKLVRRFGPFPSGHARIHWLSFRMCVIYVN